uniref:Uncharacterized protein n=1 Tax=Knipowitschia caucasica TaxID=637954 RepID=A0AAV2LRB6_KNICA
MRCVVLGWECAGSQEDLSRTYLEEIGSSFPPRAFELMTNELVSMCRTGSRWEGRPRRGWGRTGRKQGVSEPCGDRNTAPRGGAEDPECEEPL